MWIIEGEFHDPDAVAVQKPESSFQQRWLRPARVYTLGRAPLNDFSCELPRTLSRYRSITLDAGPYPTGAESGPDEPPPQYPITITNHSPKDLSLIRGESRNLIKPDSPVNIEPGDKIDLSVTDPNAGTICFHWRPVNICFSQLKPVKRKAIQDEFKDAGFSFSLSRFPCNQHTHFFPRPLAPTLPIGYALVRGIQLISESWLEDLIQATRINPPTMQKKLPKMDKKAGENEEEYVHRCQIMTSLHETQAKGLSQLEKNFQTAWKGLVPLLAFDKVPDAFKSWPEDPLKLDPNPHRKKLFSDFSVVLLANQKDDDSEAVEQIFRAGSGEIVVHCSPLDGSLPFRQQVRNLWPRPSRPGYRLLMGTKEFLTMTDCEGQAIKTVDDLLHAIHGVDISRLVNPDTDYYKVSQDGGHADNPALADDAPPARQEPAELAVGDHSTVTEPDSPQLVRRTVSRTDDDRMKELLSHATPKADEIEVLKRLATIDDPADDTLVSVQVESRAQSTAQTLNQLANENPCSMDPHSESQLSSPGSSPPLLKRKVREPVELDLDRYLPFLGQGASQPPAKPDQVNIGEGLSESAPLAKRQKVDHAPEVEPTRINRSALRLDEVDIDTIEGPVSKMLRESATQRESSLKRKASADLSPVVDADEPAEIRERNESRQKKARIQTPGAMEKSRLDLSAGGGKGTKRKPSARSNAETPKKSRSRIKEEDEDEDAGLGDRYLSVKTTGKRLTDEEIKTNLEFNRLRISKPLVLLETKPVSTRPIGWNEEDMSENELREMDDWAHKGTQPASSKSFFKIKYVSLVKKRPPGCPRQDSGDRPAGNGSHNFKKFTPKTSQSQPSFPAQPYSRRSIKMMTVQLQQPITDDHEPVRKSREPSSAQDEDEAEAESRPKLTGKGKGRSMRPEGGSQTTLNLGGAKARSTSDKIPPTTRPSKTRAPNPPSESEDEHASPRKPPPSTSTRTLSRPTRTLSKSQRGKRPMLPDPDSESDGDELAFKGFTRTRS